MEYFWHFLDTKPSAYRPTTALILQLYTEIAGNTQLERAKVDGFFWVQFEMKDSEACRTYHQTMTSWLVWMFENVRLGLLVFEVVQTRDPEKEFC